MDRAISKISYKSAKGLDGIAAGLVKCLGERSQEQLATIYTGIIQGDPIPSDWLQNRAAPFCRCPSGLHGSSQQRRQPRFSRLSLNGCSERVAEFGDPHAEHCVAVGDSRSCSCFTDDSRVVQQNNRRLQQRG
ncbi:hypothetical protein MRX96_001272 [Rhipicephalus microplus]